MAKYDSTDAAQPIPGNPRYSRTSAMTAPGSEGMSPGADEGAVIATVTTGEPGGTGDFVTHTVDVNDTSRDGQYPATEPISGVTLGGTGAGKGRAEHIPHPNAGS